MEGYASNLKTKSGRTEKFIMKIKTLTEVPCVKETTKSVPKKIKNSNDKERKKVRERVRKHRAALSEEQLSEKRRKDRERYQKKKEKGLTKSVKDLPLREQNQKRVDWRKASRRYRHNQSLLKKTQTFLECATPPPSPQENQENEQIEVALNTNKKIRGRHKVKSNRSKVYRKLVASEERNKKLKRTLERYKKRYYRESMLNTSRSSTSPFSKVQTMTADLPAGSPLTQQVKKKLLLGETLFTEMSATSSSIKTQREKHVLSKVINVGLFRKYHLLTEIRKILPYRLEKRYFKNRELTQYERKARNAKHTFEMANKVKEFLQREEHSKMCPGKKDFVIRKKIKKQRRILLDCLKNLHKKFVNENRLSMSYTAFCRLRPFWITEPKKQDRETCACIKHANMTLIVEKLYFNKCIKFRSPDEIIKSVVCNPKNYQCMNGQCKNNCDSKSRLIEKIKNGEINMKNGITFQQWTAIKEEKVISNKKRIVRRTINKTFTSTVDTAIKLFCSKLLEYKKHVFVMSHQINQLETKKKTIQVGELVLHIDFSENYITKYSAEIQAMHFGASKKQLSLHTGVFYTYNSKQSFCSVSDNLDHQAHGVWAHLKELLHDISLSMPDIHSIHFFSDGPTSQYKNKYNIFYLVEVVPSVFPSVQFLSWNYSESGHGKGPMDGVGGSLKRTADRQVLEGSDITCAADFVSSLKRSSAVKMWVVLDHDFLHYKKTLPDNVPKIPRTMSLHQITWARVNPGIVFTRELSCFSCDFGARCVHQDNSSQVKFRSTTKHMKHHSKLGSLEQKSQVSVENNIAVKPKISHKKKIMIINDVVLKPANRNFPTNKEQ